MTTETTAKEIARLLGDRSEKVAFAESCTAGMISSKMSQIPGISKYLCGSAVVYQASVKRRWLSVKKSTIKRHTTESQHVANEMALNVLRKTPEAQWSVAVVGHLGPDAPTEKDGQIFYSCARRTKKGNLKVTDSAEYVCKSKDRVARQEEATEAVLTNFARVLHKKSQADAPQNGEVPKSKGKKKKKQTV